DVLDDVSLKVQTGRLTVIMGPNGSGKTTLFKIMDLLLLPRAGQMLASWIEGRDVFQFSIKERIAWRQDVGFVFQEPYLFNKTVKKIIAYPLKIRNLSHVELDRRVQDCLERLNLEHLASKKPHQLSGGDKKRVAFAQATITQPKILLLDEPTASVDPENSQIIENYIREIKVEPNCLVLMATHDIFQAKRLADRLSFLYRGKIIEEGTKIDMFHHPRMPLTRRFVRGEIVT
ncbi:MAG: ABC transporter ATP-binding protein, partial [Promethearchaeota archaeon]